VLISRRKEGEALFIGDEVEIRVISVRRNKVILGIMAPRDVRIAAEKMTDMAMANTMAAVHPVSLDKLLQTPSNNAEPVVVMLQPISPKENGRMTDKTSGRPE
jgi:carbon storage regulator CsrA